MNTKIDVGNLSIYLYPHAASVVRWLTTDMRKFHVLAHFEDRPTATAELQAKRYVNTLRMAGLNFG